MKYETRFTPAFEIRIEGEGSQRKFSGYAARFFDGADAQGTTYRFVMEDGKEVTERIAPTAFERTLRTNPDIKLYFNHDSSTCLARTNNDRSAKLRLWTDPKGLRFEAPYDGNDSDHRKCRAKINNGTMAGCSFSFYAEPGRGDRFIHERGINFRELTDVDLDEVSMVINPAYTATNASVRSYDALDLQELQTRYHNWIETQKRFAIADTIYSIGQPALVVGTEKDN